MHVPTYLESGLSLTVGIDWTSFIISAVCYLVVGYIRRQSTRIHRRSLILEQELVSGPLTLESKSRVKI